MPICFNFLSLTVWQSSLSCKSPLSYVCIDFSLGTWVLPGQPSGENGAVMTLLMNNTSQSNYYYSQTDCLLTGWLTWLTAGELSKKSREGWRLLFCFSFCRKMWKSKLKVRVFESFLDEIDENFIKNFQKNFRKQ